ncbi:unnamed protein product [Ectocarpus sp. 13 AM-2016]
MYHHVSVFSYIIKRVWFLARESVPHAIYGTRNWPGSSVPSLVYAEQQQQQQQQLVDPDSSCSTKCCRTSGGLLRCFVFVAMQGGGRACKSFVFLVCVRQTGRQHKKS